MAKAKREKGFPVTESIITPEFRASFCDHVIVPDSVQSRTPGEEPFKKWSLAMLFDKSIDINILRTIAVKAIELAWPDAKDRPRKFNPTFKDGDNGDHTNDGIPAGEKWEGYSGCMYVNAISYKAPGVVHISSTNVPVTDPDAIYAGSYGRAQIAAQAYKGDSGFGVRFYLQNYMKTREGEPLSGGGGQKASDAFAGFASESEDTFAETSGAADTASLLG